MDQKVLIWLGDNEEKHKEEPNWPKFIEILKNKPGDIEKILADNLSKIAMQACIHLREPVEISSGDEKEIVEYYKKRFLSI